jgi:Predicted unusual protein kinase
MIRQIICLYPPPPSKKQAHATSTSTRRAVRAPVSASGGAVVSSVFAVLLYHNALSPPPPPQQKESNNNNHRPCPPRLPFQKAPTVVDSVTFCRGQQQEEQCHHRLTSTSQQSSSSSSSSLVESSSWSGDSLSLNHLYFSGGTYEFKPVLEATVRAMRLVKTVLCIVMDYKLDSYKEPLERVLDAWGMRRRRRRHRRGHHEDEILTLEKIVHEKSLALQQAQQQYTEKKTTPSTTTAATATATAPQEDEVTQQHSPEVESKEEKREKVWMAAQELAQAEMNLSTFLQQQKDNDDDKDSGQDHNRCGLTAAHERAAKRILDLCRTNGGTYIKVGQHLANLDHLLPEPYIKTLQSLFGDAPVTQYEHVREVIKEELGNYPEELFQEFQEIPIASASLAQVHVARNFQGQKLAIKVQHRGLRETSRGDLLALEYVVRLVDGMFEDFKWGWICDEIAPNLPKELDFVNEGKNAQAAANHFQKTGLNCVVPKVHWDQTTSRVLVMDFEEGYSCTNVEMMEATKVNKRDLAILISSVFQSQVFQSGFVHCDPHAENVYWRVRNGKPQLVLFDHGLYKRIDDTFRLTYAQLWKSLLLADVDGIKTSCANLGVHEMYPLLAAMLTSRPFDEVIERNKTKSFTSKKTVNMDSASDAAMIRGYAQQYLTDIIQMLDRVPRQMLLLFKMNDCLRHIDHVLGSPANTIVVAGKYAAQTVYDHEKTKTTRTASKVHNWLTHAFLITRIKLFELASKKKHFHNHSK